jgi:hypothetical protein
MFGESYLKAAVESRIAVRLRVFGKWLTTSPPRPVGNAGAEWLAGLSVDAESFTQELCELQDALRPARMAVPRPGLKGLHR